MAEIKSLIYIDTKEYVWSVDQIIRMIKSHDILMGLCRWDDMQQSQLIESILLKFPILPLYSHTEGRYHIIDDGSNRLYSIRRFILDGAFKLQGLEVLKQYEGKSFDELPKSAQRIILETNLIIYDIIGASNSDMIEIMLERIKDEEI